MYQWLICGQVLLDPERIKTIVPADVIKSLTKLQTPFLTHRVAWRIFFFYMTGNNIGHPKGMDKMCGIAMHPGAKGTYVKSLVLQQLCTRPTACYTTRGPNFVCWFKIFRSKLQYQTSQSGACLHTIKLSLVSCIYTVYMFIGNKKIVLFKTH